MFVFKLCRVSVSAKVGRPSSVDLSRSLVWNTVLCLRWPLHSLDLVGGISQKNVSTGNKSGSKVARVFGRGIAASSG